MSERDRTRERVRTPPPPTRAEPPPAREAPAARVIGTPVTAEREATKAKADIKAEAATVTAGKAGERNIAVEWLFEWVGNDHTASFDVSTAPNNALEVIVEQLQYRKAYASTGHLRTHLLPPAPIGTTFRLVVRDTTSGETVEQKGLWYRLGGLSLFSALWTWLKRQLGKAGKES